MKQFEEIKRDEMFGSEDYPLFPPEVKVEEKLPEGKIMKHRGKISAILGIIAGGVAGTTGVIETALKVLGELFK